MLNADNNFKLLLIRAEDTYNLEISLSSPEEHFLDVERENRILEERLCVRYYILPLKVEPSNTMY